MIWKIEYKRTIGAKVYDKIATFITKETIERKIYVHWIKQHSMEFIKSVQLISIKRKYPTTKDIQLDRMTGDITDKQADNLLAKRERLGMFISVPDDKEHMKTVCDNKCKDCPLGGKW